jgi:hypothetical protein
MVKLYPSLREENPGLVKFNNFLQAIGKSGLIYEKFEDVYVPPIEYEEIENNLKEHRCILIGTAEYGKTYTAIKLLWEYFKKDYVPNYVDEGSKKATNMIEKLAPLDEDLKSNVIYFKDPVGKLEYKHNEEFEESIGSIIDALGSLDVYLIVTMREEVYQEFKRIGKKDLENYVKKLNIGNHSYDYEKRKEILQRWATVMDCKWLENENLRDIVLESIRKEVKLPTPLNIKDFIMATGEMGKRDIINDKELLDLIDKESEKTPERFARDIEEMKQHGEIDKILFLCFPFISDSFSCDFVKQNMTNYSKILT